MKKKLRALKDYLFPHARNRYKPGIFAAESVAALVLVMVLLEGVYLLQINVVLKNTDFLAAVLPAALVDLANNDRAAQGVASLIADPLLDQAAQMKADDMAAKGYFSHTTPDGKTPWYWLDQVKYPYTYAGENLAVHFTDSTSVEDAWMSSPMHRANILKAQYTRVGIGVSQGVYQGKDTTFVVQFFVAPADSGPIVAAAPSVPVNSTAQVPDDEGTMTQGEDNNVLGSQTAKVPQSSAAPFEPPFGSSQLAAVTTSPYRMMAHILGTLSALFALLLVISLWMHVRKRYMYMEVILGGMMLIGVAWGILFLNRATSADIELPADSQAASVVLSLR